MKQRLPLKRISDRRLSEQFRGKRPFSTILKLEKSGTSKPRKAIKKRGPGKAKRQARNSLYYASAEWRDVKKRTHEADHYQCRGIVQVPDPSDRNIVNVWRCEERGENVNGKYTAKGLTCDELTYQRRGDGTKGSGRHEPGVSTRSLCKRCNALATVSLRANHATGFNGRQGR